MALQKVVLTSLLSQACGHGLLTLPGGRQGGSISTAAAFPGSCTTQGIHGHINSACAYQVGPDEANHASRHSKNKKDVEIPGKGKMCDENLYTGGSRNGCGGSSDKKPWHAPGTAPVSSPCGVNPRDEDKERGELLEVQDRRTWKAGSIQEVAWAPYINHGGGYAFRLCPADKKVEESCFQSNHLPFATEISELRDTSGKAYKTFTAKTTTTGTSPSGSQWRMNPIPRQKEYFNTTHGYVADGRSKYSIVDKVTVPSHLKPGNYLLSWRWDCELNWQVFSNCGDVEITASNSSSSYIHV